MMTEKDVNAIRQMITDLLSIHTENIDGKFNVIRVELSAIKEQTTKTNGRVSRHDEDLTAINKAKDLYYTNCPHNKSIGDFEAIRKYWRVFAVAGIVTGVLSVIGVYQTYDNFKDLYHKDTATQQEIKNVKEYGKENEIDINDNKKAINELGVEQSFQNSIKE